MKNKITAKRTLAFIAALTAAAAFTACGNVESTDSSLPEKVTTAENSSAESESSSQAESTQEQSLPDDPSAADSSTADSSVTDSNTDEPQEIKELDEDFISGVSAFSAELFKTSAIKDIGEGKNTLISPESVLMALGMTENGAAGDTLSQMSGVLCGGLEIDRFNENMLALRKRADSSPGLTLNIANSVWVRDDGSGRITLKDSFADKAESYFGADVFAKPFDSSTLDEINGWVNENTNEMIPSILNELSDEAVMYLINAIAFEGEWEDSYTDEQIDENGEFTNAFGEKENAVMLSCRESVYLSDDLSTGFLKYYMGGDYAFMAILPNENVSLEEYVSQMSGDSLLELFENKESWCEVETKIPEFTYEYGLTLKTPLCEMGMEQAFSDTADFSEMAETETGALYIDDVIHKTFIQLDRNGTKAAAATAVVMKDSTSVMDPQEIKYVYLDRPFLYAIVDTENGLPLFIGTVNSVK